VRDVVSCRFVADETVWGKTQPTRVCGTPEQAVHGYRPPIPLTVGVGEPLP
jgi:hypothetical protein